MSADRGGRELVARAMQPYGDMRYRQIVDDVVARGGFASRADAERLIEATLAVLSERLIKLDRQALADALPAALGQKVAEVSVYVRYGAEGFYERVLRRVGGRLGEVVERTQVVCQVLSESLDGELLARLRRHLPHRLTYLLEPSPSTAAVSAPRDPARHATGRTTLSSGRPGSQHPLSEAPPRSSQRHSVVSESNPGEARKLSSAGDDDGGTLGSGRGGSSRPLSERGPG
jgi:uncharacterized protein (DUF2267 family)